MVTNHIRDFQPQIYFLTLWLVSSSLKLQHLAHHNPPSWSRWPRFTFFSINDFTSKFIEINGNPSLFNVIDSYRRHYDTQIIEIIEINHALYVATSSTPEKSNDDDELGKKRAMGLEEWILDLEMSFLLGGIVKEVVNRRMWEVSALLLLHL